MWENEMKKNDRSREKRRGGWRRKKMTRMRRRRKAGREGHDASQNIFSIFAKLKLPFGIPADVIKMLKINLFSMS